MSDYIPTSAANALRAAHPVIAIDGPSGSGKSTISKAVAAFLQGDYVDTGATYRAMTWWMLECGVEISDPAEVAARVNDPIVELGTDPQSPSVWVDARDVSLAIRTNEVSAAVSSVAAVPEVRQRMVALQRGYAEAAAAAHKAVVMEGRDIASVVLPGADVKIWLTADIAARAARRAVQDAELLGRPSEVADVEAGLARRDAADSSRAATPVQINPDATLVDATFLDIEQTVTAVLNVALAQLGITDESL
jgi:cytidylate kinase